MCNESSINSVFQEMYKRLILPLYIIVSGFIAKLFSNKIKKSI